MELKRKGLRRKLKKVSVGAGGSLSSEFRVFCGLRLQPDPEDKPSLQRSSHLSNTRLTFRSIATLAVHAFTVQAIVLVN